LVFRLRLLRVGFDAILCGARIAVERCAQRVRRDLAPLDDDLRGRRWFNSCRWCDDRRCGNDRRRRYLRYSLDQHALHNDQIGSHDQGGYADKRGHQTRGNSKSEACPDYCPTPFDGLSKSEACPDYSPTPFDGLSKSEACPDYCPTPFNGLTERRQRREH